MLVAIGLPSGDLLDRGALADIGVEVDLLVFEAAPQPLDEDIVDVAAPGLRRGRLLPSLLIVTAWRCRVPVKSSLVNWLPPAFAGAGSGRY